VFVLLCFIKLILVNRYGLSESLRAATVSQSLILRAGYLTNSYQFELICYGSVVSLVVQTYKTRMVTKV